MKNINNIYQVQTIQLNQKILFLKKLLERNRNIQASLKKLKNASKLKIASLQQKIRNQKVYLQRPIMKTIMSYLNLMKKQPQILKQYDLLRNFGNKDVQMIYKLSTDSKDKKKANCSKNVSLKALPSNARQIDFIQLAQSESNTYKNGLQRYRAWRKDQNFSDNAIAFSHNQESLLIQKYTIYRDNWDKICNFFDGRSFQYLYYRFQYYSNKDFKKGRWTLVQNMKLIVLVQHYGQKKWAAISKRIKDRSQIQVRQRFCNILSPKISKNSWNNQQIKVLLSQAKQYDYQWSKIVQIPLFQGKTDNILWRKFKSLMIMKSQQQIKQQVEDRKLANTIIQIKRGKQKTTKKRV